MYVIASVQQGKTVYWAAGDGVWGRLEAATLYQDATGELPWNCVCWYTLAD